MQKSLCKKSILRAASPREVGYYFKEQKSHLTGSGPWTDDVFPPNRNSLLGLDSQGKFIDKDCEEDQWTIDNEIQPDQVVWKRARDIAELGPDCQLFSDGIDANDVQQGGLGTCYFLSAIAAITEFPSLIKDLLFKTKQANERGIYEVVLFIDGDWMIVPIDDWFPCEAENGQLKFTRTSGKELWVIILEKAWAKVNGGYLNISGGNTLHSLFSLTGFPCSRYVHQKVKNPQKLWEEILEAETRDDIMCTSTYGITEDEEGAQREQDYENFGLSAGHAYTLVGAKQAKVDGETIKLVLLRNPHGVFSGVNTEWTGPWCDSDPRWTPELNEQFDHSNKEDGCFWIDFFDFFKYYEDTFFCDILYDGKLNYYKYKDNCLTVPNVINFHTEIEQKMYVSVFRDTWRFVRQVKGFRYPFTLVIAGYDPNTKQILSVDGKFFFDDHHEHIRTFNPGHYLAWVYYDKDSCDGPILPEYVVRIGAIENFRSKEVGTDPEFKLLQEICSQQMRNNLKPETLKAPQILISDGDLNGTFIGCFFMQNNMKNQKLTVSGSLKYIHSYKVVGPFNKQPNYSIDLNPGDANIIVALRKPPKRGKGKRADFEITKTIRTSNPTGNGKLVLHDISKFCEDISNIKIEFSQIVNINKDQFKETKAQNKVEKSAIVVEEKIEKPPQKVIEAKLETTQPEVRNKQSSNEIKDQRPQPVTTTQYGQGNSYADSLYAQIDNTKYQTSQPVTISKYQTSSEPVTTTNYQTSSQPVTTKFGEGNSYADSLYAQIDNNKYQTSKPVITTKYQTSSQPITTTKYGEGNSYADSLYAQIDNNKYNQSGNTSNVVNHGHGTIGTSSKVVTNDNNYEKYISGNTTTSKVISSDSHDGKYVSTSTTTRVVYEGDNTGNRHLIGETTRVIETTTSDGHGNNHVVSNITRTYINDDEHEVVNVKRVSGNTHTNEEVKNDENYVPKRYEN
jgi:hypothetical protein